MKYNKQEFCKIIRDIEKQNHKAEHFADALDDLFGNSPFGSGYEFLESIGYNWAVQHAIDALSKMYDVPESNDGPIYWFIYMNDFGLSGQKYAPGITIDTPEQLYDLLTLGEK